MPYNRLHVRINDLTQHLQTTKREQIQAEQLAVEHERSVWKTKIDALQQELDQEKHDKEAQLKWQLKFVNSQLGSEPQVQLPGSPLPRRQSPETSVTIALAAVDPSDDVFAKFAQNIALLPATCAARVTKAGVLPFLTHLLREDLGDLVTGSVLLALVHLAINEKPQRPPLHRRSMLPVTPDADSDQHSIENAASPLRLNVKDEIVKAGAASPLVLILERAKNPHVAVEAARLCAALASHIPNKRVLAAKNAVRFLTQLLVPRLPSAPQTDGNYTEEGEDDGEAIDSARMENLPLPGDDETQRSALSALVNLSYGKQAPISFLIYDHHLQPDKKCLHQCDSIRPSLTVQQQNLSILTQHIYMLSS